MVRPMKKTSLFRSRLNALFSIRTLQASAVLGVCVCLVAGCDSGLPNAKEVIIISPERDAIVIGDQTKFVFQCSSMPVMNVAIGGQDTGQSKALSFVELPFENRWVATVDLPAKGSHELVFSGSCNNSSFNETRMIDNSRTNSIDVAEQLLASVLSTNEPEKLDWHWEPAIFLYPLARIAPYSANESQYLEFLNDYHEFYAQRGPGLVNWADKCAAGLSGFVLERSFGNSIARPNIEIVIDYIRNAKRNGLGSIDHTGGSIGTLIYRDSIWVDSLMMWALLAAQYGVENNDAELLDFALQQPLIFQSALKDPETGTFFHAWNIKGDRPISYTPWLRGNGWVLAATLQIIEEIDESNPYYDDLRALFVDLSAAVRAYRTASGYWDTVITDPGYAYEESSGSALIAYAYAQGVNLGLLDESYNDLARDTFSAITARMKKREAGYSMEQISSGTNPSSALFYRLIPVRPNKLYGVGAFLLLAEALADESF